MPRSPIFFAFLLLYFSLWISFPCPVSAQDATATPETPTPATVGTQLPGTVTPAAGEMTSPESGASLSGTVNLTGTASAAWRVDFSYADGPTEAWFPLAQSTEPVSTGILTAWETTALTDGLYTLRLRVFAADGIQDFKVSVRIRNYSKLETVTPTLTLTLTVTPTQTPTLTPIPEVLETATLTPVPSPTLSAPLPANPASLNPNEILLYLGKGVLAVFVIFGLVGLIWASRRK